jgi:glycosyltransferase involved in cell wall biosynthesis
VSIHVLHVIDHLGYNGRPHGVGTMLAGLLPALDPARVRAAVAILRERHGLDVWLREKSGGCPVHNLHRAKYDARTFVDICRLIVRERADIVHVHGYGASAFGRAAAWTTRRKVVLHQHDSQPAPPPARRLDRLLSRVPSPTLAVSASARDFCISARGIPPARIRVLRYGVPTPLAPTRDERLAWRAALAIPSSARIVAAAARFDPVKGLSQLIDAFARVRSAIPNALLVLWGDGAQRPALEAQVDSLGLRAAVRFAGFEPDAARRLALADCVVVPSLDEGLGMTLLEAMIQGSAIVASAVGGIPDAVGEGDAALLVPPGDARALALGVTRVLSDAHLAERLREAARRAGRNFTIARYAEDLTRFYEELLRVS